MPYVRSEDIRIHYHTLGSGPPVVMVHGFSDSIEDWVESGYVDALNEDYQLVMIDCRGHGRSDKPHSPEAYLIPSHVADVLAVMDDIGIDRATYWGYSMGGRIGFGVVREAPERLTAMVLAGIDRFGTRPDRFQNRIGFLSRGIDLYLEGFEGRFGRMEPPEKRRRFLGNDSLALIAVSMGLREGYSGNDDLIPRMHMPCLVYDGDADGFYDGARELSQMLPNARFVALPGQDHGGTFTRSDLVLPHVRGFLDRESSQNAHRHN